MFFSKPISHHSTHSYFCNLQAKLISDILNDSNKDREK